MKTYNSMLSVVCCWCLCLSLCSFSLADNTTAEKPVDPSIDLTQVLTPAEKIALQKQTDKELYDNKMEMKNEALMLEKLEANSNSNDVIIRENVNPLVEEKLNATKYVMVDEPKDMDPLQEKLNYYESNGLARSQASWDFETSDLRCDYVVSMADAYGDGWNGNVLTIGDATFTLDGVNDDGASASACYEGACDVAVTCDGGSWQSEVSWQIADADGNVLLSGGAPFSGSLDCAGGGDDGGTACDFTEYTAVCDGGSWQSEVSWTLSNAEGDDTVTGGAPFSEVLCLSDTDYTLSMVDAYGDGWNGNTWTLTDPDGTVMANCTLDTGAAGDCAFTLGGAPPVGGCMDPNAPNYNADAEVDDGSCEAYCFDGSGCGYYLDFGYTCEELVGYGYDCDACFAEGACPVAGCMDESADNFNPDATMDDGSCQYSCASYTVDMVDAYGDGWNGNVLTIGDASFTLDTGAAGQACYDGPADVTVTCDGGSWQSEVSWSISLDGAVVLEGGAPYSGCLGDCSEEVYGCTDPGAPEYDENATADDGSCWADCAGYVSWIGDGYCDGSNNNEGCGYDGGDCCPGDCVTSTYDCDVYGGDCADCADPNSADLAEGGECADAPDPTCADTDCGYYLNYGYTCFELENLYGFDCSLCEDEGADCSAPEGCWYDWSNYGSASCDTAWDEYGLTCEQLEANYNWDCSGCDCPGDVEGCADGQWDCGDGQCIPESYVCDGSSEFGNAGWGPDCSNGADETLEGCCETAAYADVDECGGGSDCEGLTVTMNDAYGDGWNGNVLAIGDATFTLETGSEGTGCYTGGMDVVVTCGGGSWQSEVSWSISDGDAVLLEGGAPYEGCLGDCSGGGDECEANAVNLTVDGGSWQSEVGWEFAGAAGGAPSSTDFCLDSGDYTLIMTDAYGDGWNGNVATFSDENGVFATATLDAGDYGEAVITVGGDPVVSGCTDPGAPEYNPDATLDDGSCWADCAAAYGVVSWINDGYCDGSNNNEACAFDAGDCCPGDCPDSDGTYDCAVYGGTCADCLDPNSADLAEGGECADYEMTCADTDCGYYMDFGYTCYDLIYVYGFDCSYCEDECAAQTTCDDPDAYNYGGVGDCQYLPDGWTCPESYAFDSWCDCGCGAYDETCDDPYASQWDNCGDEGCVDPTSPDCNEALAWDAEVTGLTAEGADFDYYGDGSYLIPAIQWDWDDLGDGTSCEENGQVTCDDGSCADTADDCPVDEWADCAASGGNTSWLGDGWCDGINNTPECGYDLGDCCPGDCVSSTYDCEVYGGDCSTCEDPDSADNADGGECADYEEWTDAECAASVTIVGGDGENDCYSDGSAYFVFDWDGGCLVTGIEYSGGYMDLAAYGFTNGFTFYGFDLGAVEDFFLYFGDELAFVPEVAADCTEAQECGEGYWDCGDGQCIPESYVCDGSSEFCNASWGPDCANGADEGLEFCGYEDECDEEQTCADTGCGYWLNYGYTCDQLSNNYGYDCSLCDAEGACGDNADDGGGSECTDCQGQDCTGYENWVGDGYCDDGAWGMYFNCDEFNCDEGDCDCSEGRSDSKPLLSTNDNINLKKYSRIIAEYKMSQIEMTKPETSVVPTTTVNVLTGEITTIGDDANRVVSYELFVNCDACLSGGPYSGSFAAATSEMLIYGFDDGSEACGSVVASSTELGSTDPSADACANAGGEDACEFLDCEGQEACGYESWVGDGYCDDGSWGFYFNCDEFDCDAGDCLDECGVCSGDGSSCACDAGDVNGDDATNVQDIVLIVGYILDGGDLDLDCADANGDGAVNVQDIVVIVNAILEGRTTSDATEARLNIDNGIASLDANGFVGAVQMTLSHGSDFSIELTDKAMVADYRTNGNSTTLIVVAPESDDLFTASGDFTVEEIIVANADSMVDVSTTADEFTLTKAYPNPFNPQTNLDITVPVEGFVNISVYNVMGQEVDVLHNGFMSATTHTVTWDASSMTSGVYFVRAESVSGITTQKVMLMK